MVIKEYVAPPEKAVREIYKLEQICNQYDNLQGSMFLDASLNFDQQIKTVFLLYEQGQLISMLSMFVPTHLEAEITGYTLPKYRGKGYFKDLVAAAVEELNKFTVSKMLFVCEAQSNVAKRVLKAFKAEYEHTEYFMRLDASGFQSGYRPVLKNRLVLWPCKPNDLKKLIETSIKIFDEPCEDAKNRIENCIKSKSREQYIAVLNGQQIGLGSSNQEDEVGSIFGFGIVPEYRGQGFGEELLHLIIKRLRQRGNSEVTLDVHSENKQAFELYKKIGFQIDTAYEYYQFNKISTGIKIYN